MEMKLFSGRANQSLTDKICTELGRITGEKILRSQVKVERFADGEIDVQYLENLRRCHVVIVQPTCPPSSETLMELCLLIDAAKRASAEEITAVVPYFGFARQDRKEKPRKPVSAKVVCDHIKSAGAKRIVAIDLHTPTIMGLFDGPFDDVWFVGSLLSHFDGSRNWGEVTLTSPDVGGVARCDTAAAKISPDMAVGFIRKSRPDANIALVKNVVADVEGRDVIFLDDMADTLGTLVNATKAVKELGARKVFAAATHALLSFNKKEGKEAVRLLMESDIEELVVSDTIPIPPEKLVPKIKVVSAAPVLARIIERIHRGGSVSSLSDESFAWVKSDCHCR